MKNEIKINIRPIGKPRMTRSDQWKKRDCVLRYWDFKDSIVKEAKRQGFILSDRFEIELYFKPNESLSRKKYDALIGRPHQVKPDIDNCQKAIYDALKKQDQTIYDVKVSKIYGQKDQIIIRNI